jgi:flavin reductase (DIM6/NTAB) family NADH-FMN oxidoreductase RutF
MDTAEFRDALGSWATGVTIVAVREPGRVVATTISAFTSLALEPPLVLLAAGPNATIRPFLQPGRAFGISILAGEQRRLASVFADPYPVGPDPFTDDAAPTIKGALVAFHCRVQEVSAGGDHAIIIAAVDAARRNDAAALVRFRRRYHTLGP